MKKILVRGAIAALGATATIVLLSEAASAVIIFRGT